MTVFQRPRHCKLLVLAKGQPSFPGKGDKSLILICFKLEKEKNKAGRQCFKNYPDLHNSLRVLFEYFYFYDVCCCCCFLGNASFCRRGPDLEQSLQQK